MFSGGEAAGEASPAEGSATRSGASGRRAARVLVAIAAVEVSATLVLLPWAWGDYHRVHGELAVYMVNMLVGHAAAASLLLAAGRRDLRTRLLGVYCLLKATLPSMNMLHAFFLAPPPPEQYSAFVQALPASSRLFFFLFVPSFLFAPAFLWAFARECPRVHRRARLDDIARSMTQVSVAVGFAIWAANVATVQFALAGYEVSVSLMADASLAILDVLALGAVVVVALRAHAAPAEEARRVVVFGTGFLLWVGASAVDNIAEVFSPGLWGANYQRSPTVVLIEVMRFPGMVVLWYSVLAARVPHVREVVRACYRRLLGGSRAPRGGSGPRPPSAWGGWRSVARNVRWARWRRTRSRRGCSLRPPSCCWGRSAANSSCAALDSWTHPEAADQRRALAVAAAALAQAGSIRTAARAITRAAKRGCGSPAVLAAAVDPADAEAFQVPDAAVTPLARTSAIVHMLESVGGTLRVHPDDDASSLFALLPREDAAWGDRDRRRRCRAGAGSGRRAGRRADSRAPLRRPHRAAGGPAVSRSARGRRGACSRAVATDACWGRLPRRRFRRRGECPDCGTVVDAGDPPGCSCGVALLRARGPGSSRRQVPADAAPGRRRGWARPTWHATCGSSVTSLSRPLRECRRPAGWDSSRRPGRWPTSRIRRSLRSTASSRGEAVRFLVVEYLAGGDARGPASARSGWRARGRSRLPRRWSTRWRRCMKPATSTADVKPSNVGFTASGSPKLLDFGLARGARDGAIVGGTLRYASPEVLRGHPADEADDVWSLCVVLYEMATGAHPFAGDGVDEGGASDPVSARRSPRRAPSVAGGTTSAGRCLRRVRAVGGQTGPAGDRAGVRRRASRGRRRRARNSFPPRPFGFRLACVISFDWRVSAVASAWSPRAPVRPS